MCVCVCVRARARTNTNNAVTVSPKLSKSCLPLETCVQLSHSTSLKNLRPYEGVEAPSHGLIAMRCERVWSATFLPCSAMRLMLFERSRLCWTEICTFSRIERKSKRWSFRKFRPKDCLISVRYETACEVKTTTFLRRSITSHTLLESSELVKLRYAVSAG